MGRNARKIPWLDIRNGVYNVFWYEESQRDPATGKVVARGRTRRFGLRTKDPVEAQNRYIAFLSAGKDVVAGTEGDAGLTVSRALDDYWREHVTAKDERGQSRVSDSRRQEIIIGHLKAWFGDTFLKDIDIPACHGYVEARRSGRIGGGRRHKGDHKKGANGTIRRELATLQAAANHASKWKRIGPSAAPPTPMPVFYKPSETEYREEADWLRKPELDLVLRSASGDLLDFITLVYWWGARRRWVEHLHVDQVDLESGLVDGMRAGERRTKKRRGIVPIFDAQRAILERRVAAAHAGDGFLFNQKKDFYFAYKQLLNTLGLESKSNPHVLRHTRATHMLMDGESIYKVAKLLHDTVGTIQRIYGHYSPEFLAEKAA